MECKEQAWQVCEQGVEGSGVSSLPLHRARCILDTLQPSSRGLIHLAPSPWKEGQTLPSVLICPPSTNQAAGQVGMEARQSMGEQHTGRMVGAAIPVVLQGGKELGPCSVLDVGFQ